MSAPDLILASASEARRTVLARAGVPFRVVVSGVDETPIKQHVLGAGGDPAKVAATLAEAKAKTVSQHEPAALVLGSDQVLVLDGKLYDKPETIDEARGHLTSLRGRTHTLISAVVLAKGGSVVWQTSETASLTMRDFSDSFLDFYLASEGSGVLSSVGAYRLEGLGSQLFSEIDGPHATILGLPLFPLLEELRNRGILSA